RQPVYDALAPGFDVTAAHAAGPAATAATTAPLTRPTITLDPASRLIIPRTMLGPPLPPLCEMAHAGQRLTQEGTWSTRPSEARMERCRPTSSDLQGLRRCADIYEKWGRLGSNQRPT